jgi:hypothetical protein
MQHCLRKLALAGLASSLRLLTMEALVDTQTRMPHVAQVCLDLLGLEKMLVPHNLLEAPPQQKNMAHGHVALRR